MKTYLQFLFIVVGVTCQCISIKGQRPDNCLAFDGHGGCVLAPSTSITQPSDQITVDLWVKYDEISFLSIPFSNSEDDHAEESGYAFGICKSKLVFLLKIDGTSGEDWYYNPGAKIEIDQWYHAAGTYDGNVIKMYLNGELMGVRPQKGHISWKYKPAQLSVGVFKDKNEQNPFKGAIDEVHVWNKVLSGDEIKTLMKKKITGKEDGLLLCYDFDEESGDIVIDKAHGNNAMFVNMKSNCRLKSFAMYRPENVSFVKHTDGTLTFSWQWVDKDFVADKFIVDLFTDEDCTEPVDGLVNVEVGDSRSFTTPVLARGNEYYFRVRANNKVVGNSCNSEIVKITDFSASLNLTLSIDQHNYLIVKMGSVNMKTVDINPSASLVKLTFVQNLRFAERTDSIRFRMLGAFNNWVVVTTKESVYQFLALPYGNYKLQIQHPDAQGLWTGTDYEIELSKSHSSWFYVFIILPFIIALLLYLFFRKRYKLRIHIQPVLNIEQTRLIQQLTNCLEVEKCFLQPDFDLAMLALRVNESKNTVSHLLAKHYKRNANDVMNYLRVEEVKKELRNPFNKNFTVCSVAFNCGFTAESSFYRIFKKETGLTPTQYIEKTKK